MSNYKSIKRDAFKLRFDTKLMSLFQTFSDGKSKNNSEKNSQFIESSKKIVSCQELGQRNSSPKKNKNIINSRSLQTFRDLRSDKHKSFEKKLFKTLPTKYSSEEILIKHNNFKKNKESKLNLHHLLVNPEIESYIEESEQALGNFDKLPTSKCKLIHSEEENPQSFEELNLKFTLSEPKDKNITFSNESSDNEKKNKKNPEYESKEFKIDSEEEIRNKQAKELLNKKLTLNLKTSSYIALPSKTKITSEIANEKIKAKNLFLYDFDSIISFCHYFPQGNIENIVHKQNKPKRLRARSMSPRRNGKITLASLQNQKI